MAHFISIENRPEVVNKLGKRAWKKYADLIAEQAYSHEKSDGVILVLSQNTDFLSFKLVEYFEQMNIPFLWENDFSRLYITIQLLNLTPFSHKNLKINSCPSQKKRSMIKRSVWTEEQLDVS